MKRQPITFHRVILPLLTGSEEPRRVAAYPLTTAVAAKHLQQNLNFAIILVDFCHTYLIYRQNVVIRLSRRCPANE